MIVTTPKDLQNNDLLDSEQNIEFPFNDQYVELIRYTTALDGKYGALKMKENALYEKPKVLHFSMPV